MTITGMSRKFTTEIRNDQQDMPSSREQAGWEEENKWSGSEEIREQHTRAIRNNIDSVWRRNWLWVSKKLPPSKFLRKDCHHTGPFISFYTLTTMPNITILTNIAILTNINIAGNIPIWTTTNDRHAIYINQWHCSSTQRCHRFRRVFNHLHCR